MFDSLALLVYCGLIYWLSDQPTLPLPMLFAWQDKLEHFTAYFIMSSLAWRSFRHFIRSPVLLLTVSALFCSIHGALDEWHQSFVEGRDANVLDWLADTLGAIVAMLVFAQLFRLIKSYRV